MSNESIKPATAPDLTLQLYYVGTKTIVSFSGVWLKQEKVTLNHGKIVNICIVYRLIKLTNPYKNNNLTVKNALFGAVTLTKNADIDKYKYSGYGIVFDKKPSFSLPNGESGQNVIVFGVHMNSYIHIDNIRLILPKIIQNFVWVCITIELIVTYLLMVQKLLNLKQKMIKLWQTHYV